MDTTFGTDHTKRVMLDVNQVISPTLAIRAGGLFQDAGVAGRDYITDDRGGGFVATKWTPLDTVKLYANYIHTDLHGLPDFGVPYYRPGHPCTQYTTTAGGPYPDFGVNRNNFYGFVNRDFYSIKQDIGTFDGEVEITPDLTLSNKTRVQHSVLDYIGTLPEAPVIDNPTCDQDPQRQSAEPLSGHRRLANQTEATYKFDTGAGSIRRWAASKSRARRASIDSYTGLSSEALPGGIQRHGLVGRRQHLQSAIHVPAVPATPTLTGNADQDRHRHQERLCDRHRQLP